MNVYDFLQILFYLIIIIRISLLMFYNESIHIKRVEKTGKSNHEKINKLNQMINEFTEERDFFIMGEKRVNVLKLNIALDKTDFN